MRKDPNLFSDQAKRLYLAAKKLRGVEGKSAVARLLNISPQSLTNWENGRPISNEGLVVVQEKIGCNAIWLRDGVGPMEFGAVSPQRDLSDVAELVALYNKLDDEGRRLVLTFTREAADVDTPQNQGASSGN